ncbi:hypothetical protein CW306_09255 [Bacillus sp. BA3]|nr:hypothetical protein CW306_09255 [Bacillus sp. BA3]
MEKRLHNAAVRLVNPSLDLSEFVTLLPNNWDGRDPTAGCGEEALAGNRRKGSGFLKSSWKFLKEKNCRQTRFSSSLSTV